MCLYKRNSNCHAFITVTPNPEGLIISKKPDENSRARFFINLILTIFFLDKFGHYRYRRIQSYKSFQKAKMKRVSPPYLP